MMVQKISSRKNPLIQHVRKLFSSRSYRSACGEYAADGIKLLKEAVQWIPNQIKTVIKTSSVQLELLPDHVQSVEVPDDLMRQISPMETPQGVLFVCVMPEAAPLVLSAPCLILDGIQDPGNMGTILRTADAMDIPAVLSGGCADAYNPKTVRASMGSVFRTPPQIASQEEILQACSKDGIPLCVTALSDDAADLRKADLSGAALVIGSEGHGVGSFFLKAARQKLIIPMNPRCESLNAAVAAALVMWEMKRGKDSNEVIGG